MAKVGFGRPGQTLGFEVQRGRFPDRPLEQSGWLPQGHVGLGFIAWVLGFIGFRVLGF